MRIEAQPVEMISGPAGPIEVLAESAASANGIAVVCHPHPLHQGTMQNKVVYTLARSFRRLGAHAVRFNFRGVGDSTGRFDEGIGETHDARAVIAWARRRWPGLPVYLAGFSFGAMVAFNASRQIGGLVLVAPPVTKYAFAPTAPACSWLVIQGDRDEIVSPAAVRRWCEAWRPPPTLIMIGGATHFFHGSLGKISDAVRNHFGSRLAVTDSGNGDHGC